MGWDGVEFCVGCEEEGQRVEERRRGEERERGKSKSWEKWKVMY